MKKLTSYFPFALVLAVVLALGAFAMSMVSADVAGPISASADPTTPGAVAQYRVNFVTTEALAANVETITIRFDKDASVPGVISRNNIVISASEIVGGGCTISSGATPCAAGQAVPLSQDPVVAIKEGGEGEMDVKITVPDMDPATTGIGTGVQSIAATAEITVTISAGAGIKNPTEGGGVQILVRTSMDPLGPPLPFMSAPGIDIPRTLTLSAIDGGRGSTLTVTGKGFKDGVTATVWLDDNDNETRDPGEIDIGTAVVGSDDTFTASITVSVPPFDGGANNIMAVDGRNNPATDAVTFTVLGSVTATPREAALGDTITITLKDFPPSTALTNPSPTATVANIGGVALPIPGQPYPPTGTTPPGVTPVTDATGEVTFSTIVPNGVPIGSQSLQFGFGTSGIRRTTLTIKGATITLTPDEVVPNQTVTLIGNGFTTAAIQTNVNLGPITIDGVAISPSKINEGLSVPVDAGGNWSTSVVVPVTTNTTTTGTHELKVTDQCVQPFVPTATDAACDAGREGTVTLKIKPRTITLDPAVSRLGTRVNITGSGFPASNTKSGADSDAIVAVEYGSTNRTVATLTPDASGNLSGSFTVPLDAPIPSTNSVTSKFTTTTGPGTLVTTTVTHSVPRASLTITPNSGAPGTSVTLSAQGFKSFTTVSDMKIGTLDVRPSPVPNTGSSGDFTTTILIPELAVGTHTVEVKVGGTTASTSFSLTSGTGGGTPGATVDVEVGLAPLGDNLVRVWGFTGTTFMLYDPATPILNDLEQLQRGKGYWLNVEEGGSVTLGTGSYDLVDDWNLIGWLG